MICEICPVLDLTTSAAEVKAHRHEVHKKGSYFCCPHCEKQVKTGNWAGILFHISGNHQDLYKKNISCEICDKTFIFSALSKHHKNKFHSGKKHVCDVCGKDYSERDRLKNHILVKHNSEGAPKLFCDKCGFSTISKIALNNHINKVCKKVNFKNCVLLVSQL